MIHSLPVLTAILLYSSASLSLAAAAEAEWDSELEVLGTCDSDTGDCISGYTSLLQGSVDLHRHGKRRIGSKHATSAIHQGAGDRWTLHQGLAAYRGQKESSWSFPAATWMLIGGAVFAILFVWFVVRPAMNEAVPVGMPVTQGVDSFVTRNDEEEQELKIIHPCFSEDTFGLAISILIRDLRFLARGDKQPGLKYSRISFALLLVFMTIGIQTSVIICTKQFVTPNQVANIRDAYDKFEQVMYNGHTYLNANGKHRGMPGYFNVSAFADLDDDSRSEACNIPFSQLGFLCLILGVWSITCFINLKSNVDVMMALMGVETKDNMADCLMHWEDAVAHQDGREVPKEKHIRHLKIPIEVIVGLTMRVKAFLMCCVLLPEFIATCYILWLGSRWLTATNDFGDIVCNTVALEFVLQLKCLLFFVFASERSKRELSDIGILPSSRKTSAGWIAYFHTLVWLFLSLAWVYLYVFHFQHVLPDYQWDVHTVCTDWLINILKKS